MNVKEEICKNLLYYRKKNKLTQKELADKLGVKHNAISSWESGTNSIDVEVLFKICQLFDITVNDMYGVYSTNKVSDYDVSCEAIEVAEAYDKAPFKDKNMARMALNLPLLETDVTEIKASGNKGEQAG